MAYMELVDKGIVNGKHVTVASFIKPDTKILDEGRIQDWGKELFAYADARKPDGEKRVFILDMTNVGYFSTAAYGKLITLEKKLRAQGDSLIIGKPRKDILEVFKITRLDKEFNIRGGDIEEITKGGGIKQDEKPVDIVAEGKRTPFERGQGHKDADLPG